MSDPRIGPYPADFMALSRDLERRQAQRERENPVVAEIDPRNVKAEGPVERVNARRKKR